MDLRPNTKRLPYSPSHPGLEIRQVFYIPSPGRCLGPMQPEYPGVICFMSLSLSFSD